jgi:3-oxoacyl-[acyl-carrier-protein] synthase I
MSMPLGILGCGMATGVGLSAKASCAAIRCGINNFSETRFISESGDWIVGSEVPLDDAWRGLPRLAKMVASVIRECLDALPKPPADASVPLVLCLAEEDRPGRVPGLGGPLLLDIERELGIKFHPESSVIAQGRVGGAVAVLRAQKHIEERRHPHVVVAGVDSYLTSSTLAAFEERARLLTSGNSNGFVPGEAAAAVLLGGISPEKEKNVPLICRGIGFAREPATIESDQPLRADGIVEAIRAALAAAGCGLDAVDHRIADVSGEQYRFKEAALAVGRILRQRKEVFGIWHPADCIGEVGAAALPSMLAVLYHGARKRYLPGKVFLAHLSNDDDKRAALILGAPEVV